MQFDNFSSRRFPNERPGIFVGFTSQMIFYILPHCCGFRNISDNGISSIGAPEKYLENLGLLASLCVEEWPHFLDSTFFEVDPCTEIE
jgi:hypothetical protein